jgi:TonB family protein
MRLISTSKLLLITVVLLLLRSEALTAGEAIPALPPEIRDLTERDRTIPPQTILDFQSADSTISDTTTAVVWIKFQAGRNEVMKDLTVVFSSLPNLGLEESALTATKEGKFEAPRMSSHKQFKWLYHEVVFNHQRYVQLSRDAKRSHTGAPGPGSASPLADDIFFQIPPGGWKDLKNEPEAIHLARPRYPKEALVTGKSGSVWVKVLVDMNGTVRRSLVAKSSGYAVLDSVAVRVAYRSKFNPAVRKNGEKVACWVTYTAEFGGD